MADSRLPPPAEMDLKGDVVSNWQYFRESFENYERATELRKKSDEVRVNTLLHVMGKECYMIYKNLPIPDGDKKETDKVLKHLQDYFMPKRNIIYERYIFSTTNQEKDEKLDVYLTRLRKLIATCDYGTLHDEMLRDRLVIGIHDN